MPGTELWGYKVQAEVPVTHRLVPAADLHWVGKSLVVSPGRVRDALCIPGIPALGFAAVSQTKQSS